MWTAKRQIVSSLQNQSITLEQDNEANKDTIIELREELAGLQRRHVDVEEKDEMSSYWLNQPSIPPVAPPARRL